MKVIDHHTPDVSRPIPEEWDGSAWILPTGEVFQFGYAEHAEVARHHQLQVALDTSGDTCTIWAYKAGWMHVSRDHVSVGKRPTEDQLEAVYEIALTHKDVRYCVQNQEFKARNYFEYMSDCSSKEGWRLM